MKNCKIIIGKQIKDTVKNKNILIQFILFPLITLVMERAIHIDDMPPMFFTRMFSTMFMGMAPLTCTAAIISEEKEKNTLRVLLMSNVKPWEYLLGIGMYVWLICMIGAAVMSTGFSSEDRLIYLIIMGIGFAISTLLGACIGIISRNQMAASSIATPVMMILSFVPMIASFNSTFVKYANLLYTQQFGTIINKMSLTDLPLQTYIVIASNLIVMIVIFCVSFKRKGIE